MRNKRNKHRESLDLPLVEKELCFLAHICEFSVLK